MNMDLGRFTIAMLRHMAMAAGFAVLALLGLEWLLPGSVLPFVDLINYLPLAIAALVAAFATSEDVRGFNRAMQLFLGILAGGAALAILAALVGSRRISAALLVGAGIACIAVWLVGSLKTEK